MKRILLGLAIVSGLYACGDDRKSSETATAENIQNDTITRTQPIASETVPAESSETQYGHEVVVPDLQIAWGLDFLPDGSMLITEKSGELIHFKDGQKNLIQGAPEVYNRGQGGFLDVAVHPDYDSNGWIYFTYSSSEGEEEGGNTALMRAKLENGQLVQKEDLYKATPNSTRGQHFGSRISFLDGYLYFSIGDRGNRDENPQDITRDGGKVYRLNLDGSIPTDNPFVGQENAKEAVFSYGHRNPQGMTVNTETGEIWVHEHGPQGGDEINVIKKGENYGWPVVSFGINYDNTIFTEETYGPDFEDPIFHWTPSIAPSGLVFVTSDKVPEFQGNLLAGSLKFMYVELLELEGKKVIKREKLLEGLGRVRDIVQGPDGSIYVSVEGVGIVRITKNENSNSEE